MVQNFLKETVINGPEMQLNLRIYPDTIDVPSNSGIFPGAFGNHANIFSIFRHAASRKKYPAG